MYQVSLPCRISSRCQVRPLYRRPTARYQYLSLFLYPRRRVANGAYPLRTTYTSIPEARRSDLEVKWLSFPGTRARGSSRIHVICRGSAMVDCSKAIVTRLKPVKRALPSLPIRAFVLGWVNACRMAMKVSRNIPFEIVIYCSLVVHISQPLW